MKGVNTILSVLALIGVGYLFFKPSPMASQVAEGGNSEFPSAKIGFVIPDSVAEYYSYYKELLEELDAKKKVIDDDLAKQGSTFQEEVMIYQKNAANISEQRRQTAEQELGARQQQLEAYARQLDNELKIEQEKVFKLIREEMEIAVKEVREELGLDYVLTYDASNFVQSANEDFDISKKVIKQLNENHSAKTKSEE